MRRFVPLFLLLLFAPAAATQLSVQQARPVRLAARIVEQRYCAGDASAGTDFLHFKLELRYENTGERKAIVYRGHNLFYVIKITRGAGEAAAPTRRPDEWVATHARFFDERPEQIEASAPGKAFAVLAPRGGSLRTETTISVPVARAGGAARTTVNAIAPGEHALRLTVSNWYKSKPLAESLRERWKKHGFLLVEPVTSAPVPFETVSHDTIPRCR